MKPEDDTSTQLKVTSCLMDAGVPEYLAIGVFDILSETGQISSKPPLLLRKALRIVPPVRGAEKLGCTSLQVDRLFGAVEQLIYDPKLHRKYEHHLYCRQVARIKFDTKHGQSPQ